MDGNGDFQPFHCLESQRIHPRKLACPLKINGSKMYFLLNGPFLGDMLIFRGVKSVLVKELKKWCELNVFFFDLFMKKFIGQTESETTVVHVVSSYPDKTYLQPPFPEPPSTDFTGNFQRSTQKGYSLVSHLSFQWDGLGYSTRTTAIMATRNPGV